MESSPGPSQASRPDNNGPAIGSNGLSYPPSTSSTAFPAFDSNNDVETAATASPAVSSPPYWTPHSRRISALSVDSIAGGITLQDNTDGQNDKNEACWARGVRIDEHVVVNGRGAGVGIGAFVVWDIRVETLHGPTFHIRKRYSDFVGLRERLVATFPYSEAALPALPPKGVIFKFRPKFLEQRRIGLSYFLNCILLNPEFSGSPVLKDFIFN